MKNLSSGLQDHLDTGATTLCWCWSIKTTSGEAFGFTDHDNNLQFGNLVFEASTGFNGSEIETGLGLAVDNLDVEGAISSDKLSEQDLFAGKFDNAEVKIWLVNWQNVTQRVLLRSGNLGEVTRTPLSFSAEIRGITHNLNQPQGRLFQYSCDTSLGSARCGVDLDNAQNKASGNVGSFIKGNRFLVNGIDGYETNWFSHGQLTFTSGDNIGRSSEIKSHQLTNAGVMIQLWQQLPDAILGGDQFEILVGCDKVFSTCKQKFSNEQNFQGFPHMPGNDFVAFYPNRDDGNNDGSPVV